MLHRTKELEKYFQEFDEDDEMAFGKYHADSLISRDVFAFSICGHDYLSRIILDGFKVILESICQDVINHQWLCENETLVADCLSKVHSRDLAFLLATKEDHLECTGDTLLMYGFKRL